jgi:predicted metal-binding membrane protein
MLLRYRHAVGGPGEQRLGRLTTMAGAGYFFIWTAAGAIAFPLGIEVATIEMQNPELARAVPAAVGVVVLIAGALQFTEWKARHLACCRETPECDWKMASDLATAWRHGLRLGIHCAYSCAGLTAILLVIGVMDLRAMAVVGAAVTAERLAPSGVHVARIIGVFVVATGLFLVVRGAGLV